MSDAFALFGAVVALSAPLVAGPAGITEPDHAIVLGGSERAGASSSAPVFYRNGEEAGTLGVDRPTVTFSDLPNDFINALMAVEDSNFFSHMGIDPIGTMRAVKGVATGRFAGGGSTLTQQLAKNVITGPAQSIKRKIEEAYAAIVTESLASKEEIIESYANAVFFGRRSQGAARAPLNWFGREWENLSISEYAFLAGVLQAPSALDPNRNLERAVNRRNHVINRMLDVGFITQEQANSALSEDLIVSRGPLPTRSPFARPDYDFWTVSEARRFITGSNLLDLAQRGGFTSTIDFELQKAAQETLSDHLHNINSVIGYRPLGLIEQAEIEDNSPDSLMREAIRIAPFIPNNSYRAVFYRGRLIVQTRGGDRTIDVNSINIPRWLEDRGVYVILNDNTIRGVPQVQGSMVVVDSLTNETIVSIGGTLSWASEFDRSQANRQPGSAIKPFIWLAALDNDYNPEGLISGEVRSYRDGNRIWRPQNYGRRNFGLVPFYEAFERSLNTVAVRIGDFLGMDLIAEYLEDSQLYEYGNRRIRNLSATIGTIETTPTRMAKAMANLDWRVSDLAQERSLQDLERMMRGVVTRGTAAGAFRSGPDANVIGKTGTSQSFRDVWFAGRAGRLAFAVWIGRDDDRSLPIISGRSPTGGAYAAPLVADFLSRIQANGFDLSGIISPPFGQPWNYQYDSIIPQIQVEYENRLYEDEQDEWNPLGQMSDTEYYITPFQDDSILGLY